MKFRSITACLDMAGCPNRCRHCWLGHVQNNFMSPDDLRFLAKAFRPYTEDLEVFSWYREPDFRVDFRELWALEDALSDHKTSHFELMSVWRAAQDPEYVPWLAGLGIKEMQLTLFGGEALTDKYTGRRGAWNDLMRSIELLRANGIVPRIQIFVNKETGPDLAPAEALVRELDCPAFLHAGSCVGANAALYDLRVTPDDLTGLPEALVQKSLSHWNKPNIRCVFGKTEAILCSALAHSQDTASFVSQTPVFYIDSNWDVYPNISAPGPAWHLGNLKRDGPQAVLACYREENSPAQRVRCCVPLGTLVRACGNFKGQGLFTQSDFIDYILDKYVLEKFLDGASH